MSTDRPPTIDPVAAARWECAAPPRTPWLHEEVGRRMAQRLQWIRMQPSAWADWQPVRGGLEAHALVARQYPKAQCFVVEAGARHAVVAQAALVRPWWQRLTGPATRFQAAGDGAVQMLWSNMALHMAADPQARIAQWHRALATDGFLMFSCMGPDSLRELRSAYASLGWPPPAHEFTDMHDWGDMLVHAGFAEPVMDMERITLTWESAARMRAELRELGSNLHPARFAGLRARGWRERLDRALGEFLAATDGRLALTFEIIYGHALKPAPRVRLAAQSAVPLGDMRAMLKGGQRPRE